MELQQMQVASPSEVTSGQRPFSLLERKDASTENDSRASNQKNLGKGTRSCFAFVLDGPDSVEQWTTRLQGVAV